MIFALAAAEAAGGFAYKRREIGGCWFKLKGLENFLPSGVREHVLKFCFNYCSLLSKWKRCKIFFLHEEPTDTLARQTRALVEQGIESVEPWISMFLKVSPETARYFQAHS